MATETMTPEPVLRPFSWADIPAIAAIYAHYVENSVATFDLSSPTERQMADKFGAMLEADHPVIVLEAGGVARGFAYASTYRPRPAYRFTCEDSVYLAPDFAGRGLGSRLLAEVIARAGEKGFRQMVAVITASSANSIALHERYGFAHVGRHAALGFKFDAWHDVVHMQRAL